MIRNPCSPIRRARIRRGAFRSHATVEAGADAAKGRIRAESFADHYSQARLFYRSQSAIEQAHLASTLVFELAKVAHLHVRQAMVGHLRHIDADLAQRVADGLALPALPEAPPAAAPVQDMPPSPALQIIGRMRDTLQGRAVGILVADGSDGAAVEQLRKAALDAGAGVKIVAPKVGGVTLADGKLLPADGQLAGTPSVMFDAVAVVLSAEGAQMLCKESAAIDFVSNAFVHLKAIAASQEAQPLLDKANVVADAGVLGAGDPQAFIAAAKTRQWQREPSVRTLA